MYSTEINEDVKLKILPAMNSDLGNGNTAWVGTFQLVWNEFMANITKGEVQFEDGNNSTVDNLNRQEFTKNDICADSYYIKNGVICPELKDVIINGIKEKFDEKSDILNQVNFDYNPRKILFYAMLKKNFEFLEKFDNLDDDTFGSNEEDLVEYFGIDSDSEKELYKNVSVLFYSEDDYAVKLHTKTNDEVILYRTDEIKTFNEYFNDVQEKFSKYSGNKSFSSDDYLMVPKLDFSATTSFEDVENKTIKNTDGAKIDKTIETLIFKMDECGVKLKSEAVIFAIEGCPPPENRRYFEFNQPFVLFLKEKDKEVPYFAMRVVDAAMLNNNEGSMDKETLCSKMPCPKGFIERLKNKNLEDLLEEQSDLVHEIWEYEHRDKLLDDEFTLCPTPDVVYQMNQEYLDEICILIGEKYFGKSNKFLQEEFFDFNIYPDLTVLDNIPLDIEPNVEIKSFKFERGGHFGNYQLYEYRRTKTKRILKYSEEGNKRYFFLPFKAELPADFDKTAMGMIKYFTRDFGVNPDVCDGEWFSFKATLSNGQKIKSEGYNWFPETYSQFIIYLEHFYYLRV